LRRTAATIVGLAILCAAGCSDIAAPQLFSPGTASVQRTRAQRFDPYPNPLQGMANGTDRDGRPRDYLEPPPEADRAARSARGLGYPDRWQSVGN
jgi:hypothetical protein